MNKKYLKKNCDSDWIRTNDLLLRRQLLYPTELPNHYIKKMNTIIKKKTFNPSVLIYNGRKDKGIFIFKRNWLKQISIQFGKGYLISKMDEFKIKAILAANYESNIFIW